MEITAVPCARVDSYTQGIETVYWIKIGKVCGIYSYRSAVMATMPSHKGQQQLL